MNVYSRSSPCIGLHGYYLYITRDSNGGLHNNTNNNNNNFIIIITIGYSLSPRLEYFSYSTLASDSCRNVRVCANINDNWFTTTGQHSGRDDYDGFVVLLKLTLIVISGTRHTFAATVALNSVVRARRVF